MKGLARIGLGGGCHWCTEGVFVSLQGVHRVDQGWIASQPPHDALSEAIVVHYDPTVVTLAELIAVHLRTHSAAGNHPLRERYRSAVYYFDGEAPSTEAALNTVAESIPGSVITRALPFVTFKASLPEHWDYYRADPERPFCVRYIQPKLDALARTYPELLRRK